MQTDLAPFTSALTSCFERLRTLPYLDRVAGLDPRPLFAEIDRVECAWLGDTAMRITTRVFEADARVIAGICETYDGEARQVQIGLWLTHELLHVRVQDLEQKSRVDQLRTLGLGGELSLLHLDLGADHFAAVLVARAFGRTLLEIKHEALAALTQFPASPRHSTAGWFRKALRLVSLHADTIVRVLVPIEDSEYVFVDFSPSGEKLVFFASGPPFRVLRVATLGQTEAKELLDAVDGESRTETIRVDDILRACWEGLGNPGRRKANETHGRQSKEKRK